MKSKRVLSPLSCVSLPRELLCEKHKCIQIYIDMYIHMYIYKHIYICLMRMCLLYMYIFICVYLVSHT